LVELLWFASLEAELVPELDWLAELDGVVELLGAVEPDGAVELVEAAGDCEAREDWDSSLLAEGPDEALELDEVEALAPLDCWYWSSAACVRGPMMPSIGPGSKPASFSICCCWRTWSLPLALGVGDCWSDGLAEGAAALDGVDEAAGGEALWSELLLDCDCA